MERKWGKATDTGRVRKNNQDYTYADGRIFIVADGMGGANGGEIASRMAVDSFTSRAAWAQNVEGIRAALDASNETVFKMSLENPDLSGMGTTFVAVVHLGEGALQRVYILNVGDSRAYVFRDSEITQITEDHSWVGELYRAGRLSLDDAARSSYRHVMTRAVGVGDQLDIDIWDFIVTAGDRVFLCSDGVTNELTDPEIGSILEAIEDPQAAADEVVRRAIAAGGTDNASVIVIDYGRRQGDEGEREVAAAPPGIVGSGSSIRPIALQVVAAPRGERGPNLGSIPVPLSKGEFTKAGTLFRIATFVTLLLAVGAVGVYGIGKYVRGSYYVGVSSGNHIAIFQGRPGGLLWFSPRLVSLQTLMVSQLPGSFSVELANGVDEPNYRAALRYVNNLQTAAIQFRQASGVVTTTTSTAPVTTTTVTTTTTKAG